MKSRSLIAAAALALAGTSFAAMHEHSQKDIKLLNDSAAALSSINPDLSGRLQDYATRESGETGEMGQQAESQDQRETAGQVGEQAKPGDSKQDVQLLKDSADALKPTRPGLAKGLRKFAAKEQKEMKGTRGMRGSQGTEGGQARPGGGY